jgi:sporulation protein YlmC with PRC-barrel domain
MSLASSRAKGNYILGVRKSIIGSPVINAERQDLGRIEDLVVDSRTNQIAYAILSFGGFFGVGDKHFAIPWEVIHFDSVERQAVLNIEQDRLNNAPGFEKENWPDMTSSEWASRIRSH